MRFGKAQKRERQAHRIVEIALGREHVRSSEVRPQNRGQHLFDRRLAVAADHHNDGDTKPCPPMRTQRHEHAVDRVDAELGQHVRQLGEPRRAEREALVGDSECRRGRRRIAIKRDEPALGTERGQDAPRVTAAPESRIDVGAARDDREPGDGFFKQDGDVRAIRDHQSEKPSSSGGSPPAGNATTRAVASFQRAASHNSNL